MPDGQKKNDTFFLHVVLFIVPASEQSLITLLKNKKVFNFFKDFKPSVPHKVNGK